MFLLFFFFFKSVLETNKVYASCFLVNAFEEQTCTLFFFNEEDLNKWAKGSWPQHGRGEGGVGRRKINEFLYSFEILTHASIFNKFDFPCTSYLLDGNFRNLEKINCGRLPLENLPLRRGH